MDFVVSNVNDCLFEQAFMAVDDYDCPPFHKFIFIQVPSTGVTSDGSEMFAYFLTQPMDHFTCYFFIKGNTCLKLRWNRKT